MDFGQESPVTWNYLCFVSAFGCMQSLQEVQKDPPGEGSPQHASDLFGHGAEEAWEWNERSKNPCAFWKGTGSRELGVEKASWWA